MMPAVNPQAPSRRESTRQRYRGDTRACCD
jgi:hypothetical protein